MRESILLYRVEPLRFAGSAWGRGILVLSWGARLSVQNLMDIRSLRIGLRWPPVTVINWILETGE